MITGAITIGFYLIIFAQTSSRYKTVDVYWSFKSNITHYFWNPHFLNVTEDGVPEIITTNSKDTIYVFNVVTRSLYNEVRIPNSNHLKVLETNDFWPGNISTSGILVYSIVNNSKNYLLIVNPTDGTVVWSYDLGSTIEYITKSVYYDSASKNIIVQGPKKLMCINLDSRQLIWDFPLEKGLIFSSTKLTSILAKDSDISGTEDAVHKNSIVIWSITQYGKEPRYTLYCIDNKEGKTIWTKEFIYPSNSTAHIVTEALLNYKYDFNDDCFEDLIVVDEKNIYLINGIDGSVLKQIHFLGIRYAIVDDFNNDGHIELIAESHNGTLIDISIPSGTELWSKKLSQTKLCFAAPVNPNNIKNVLLLGNGTYTLINGLNGQIIFNKSILSTFFANNDNSFSLGDNSDLSYKFSWTNPLFTDLNNDRQNEILIGVYTETYTNRLKRTQSLTNTRNAHFYALNDTKVGSFSVFMVVDPESGNVVDFVNMTELGLAYLNYETYEITTSTTDYFVILLAYTTQGVDENYIVIIRFSEE